MLRKLAVIAAASSMIFGTTLVQAKAASALEARAATATAGESNLIPHGPLFAIIGIIAIVGILEATEVINIFGGDDEPESP